MGINHVQVGTHELTAPSANHAWLSEDGSDAYAAVSVGACRLVFSDPQLARDVAAACESAAAQLEQIAAERSQP